MVGGQDPNHLLQMWTKPQQTKPQSVIIDVDKTSGQNPNRLLQMWKQPQWTKSKPLIANVDNPNPCMLLCQCVVSSRRVCCSVSALCPLDVYVALSVRCVL